MEVSLQSLDELRRRSTLLNAPILGTLCFAGAWVIPSLPARPWEVPLFLVNGILFYCAGLIAWRRPKAITWVARFMMLQLTTIIEIRLLNIFNGPIFQDQNNSLFLMLFAHMPMCYLFAYMIFPSQIALRWSIAICVLFGATTLNYLLPAFAEMPTREGARHLLMWTLISSPAFVLLISNLHRFENVVLRLNHEHDAVSARQEIYKHQATHDYLTGLLNRLSFDTELANCWKQAKFKTQPLALLMIDVDHFKNLNDQYGHRAGDQALQQLAIILSHQVRERDIVTRYGGEEFAILLSNTQLNAALRLAERLRTAVSHSLLNTGEHKLNCTISIGVACVQPRANLKSEVLLNQADKALYLAKSNGSNQVVCSDSELSLNTATSTTTAAEQQA